MNLLRQMAFMLNGLQVISPASATCCSKNGSDDSYAESDRFVLNSV